MTYALVSPGGVIENAIIYDGESPVVLPEGWEMIPMPAGAWIGWTRDGDTWAAPPAE